MTSDVAALTMEQTARAQPAAHGVAYRPEIDGLRTIAVSSVILYHAGVPWFTGGYVGVDIFFVISGYLISSIIFGDLANGRFTFLNFYERRIRRIFPALFTVLVASIIAAWFVFTPGQLDDFGKSLVATTAFVANFYFWMHTGYFNGDTENSALIHMWSLAVEEQFYVLFPVLLLILARIKVIGRNPVLIVAVVLSLVWCLHREATDPIGNFFSTPARAWELLAGALVAVNRERWLRLVESGTAALAAPVAEIIGAVLMVGSIFAVTTLTRWPGVATIPVVLGTALVILAARQGSPFGRMLALRPMVALGLVSYSAYLWHQPLFAFTHAKMAGALPSWLTACLIVSTFGLAWLSWRFVETPFRSRDRVGRWAIFSMGAAATVVTVGVGLVLHSGDGFPDRFDKSTMVLASSIQTSPYRTKCNNAAGADYVRPERACRYVGQDTTWAVLGDSHAIDLGYVLAQRLKPSGQGVVQLTFNGCQAALTFKSDTIGCSEWTGEAVRWLERQLAITNVLIVYRHTGHLFGDQRHTYPNVPDVHPTGFLLDESSDAAREAYWSSFLSIVQRMRASGKRVYIVRPIPELPIDVERFIYGTHMIGTSTGTTMAYYRARNAWVNDRLDRLVGMAGVTLIDPTFAMCDTQQCRSLEGQRALYSDDNHPTLLGAQKILDTAVARGTLPKSPIRK